MNYNEVIALLEENQDERGIAYWEKSGIKGIKSFGMGLTVIKKLAKGIDKSQDLADELWNSNVLEAKHMSCLIREPKKLDAAQLEERTLQAAHWMVSHTFVQNVLAKSKLKNELSDKWRASSNDQLRSAGYNILYYSVKDKNLDDAYFAEIIPTIKDKLQSESNFVRDGMNTALFGIGQRSADLHKTAFAAAKHIGPVIVDYGDNSCQAVDVVKHLSSDRIKAKFGL